MHCVTRRSPRGVAIVREHHITVARTARYFTLGEPSELVRELWIVCHGHGQLASRFLRHFEGLQDLTRLIVAPEALSRYYMESPSGTPGTSESHASARIGATWMTREDRLSEIADYVSYLDALSAALYQQLDRSKVTLHVLGFSQGVATVCRWVASGRTQPERVILWGGVTPPDLDLPALRAALDAADLVLVAGDADEVMDAARLASDADRLRDAGIAQRSLRFPGGHRLDADTLATLAAESLGPVRP